MIKFYYWWYYSRIVNFPNWGLYLETVIWIASFIGWIWAGLLMNTFLFGFFTGFILIYHSGLIMIPIKILRDRRLTSPS